MGHHAEHLRAVLEHPYDSDTCFVCACKLDGTNRTDEHVIPQWLQQAYSLHDQRLVLLNQTSIPYRQLTLPCCFECNNKRLSPLENRISAAFASGYEAVDKIPSLDLFRWLAKIYLGLQFKEVSLLYDRSAPDSGAILDSDFLRQYSILHFWLQMASCANDPEYCPGSIWVFPAQTPSERNLQFDLKDDAANGVIAIRTESVIVIADFLDNGVHAEISNDHFAPLKTIPLHPLQFQELVAMIVYGAKRLCQETQVTFFQTDVGLAYTVKCSSTTDGDAVMSPWVKQDYVKILSYFTQIPVEQLYFPGDFVMSWLRNPRGSFVYWQIDTPHPFSGQTPTDGGS